MISAAMAAVAALPGISQAVGPEGEPAHEAAFASATVGMPIQGNGTNGQFYAVPSAPLGGSHGTVDRFRFAPHSRICCRHTGNDPAVCPVEAAGCRH